MTRHIMANILVYTYRSAIICAVGSDTVCATVGATVAEAYPGNGKAYKNISIPILVEVKRRIACRNALCLSKKKAMKLMSRSRYPQ